MKHLLITLLFVLTLTSCVKEEESIEGTTWINTDDVFSKTFSFNKTTCTYSITSSFVLSYTYILDFPKVYMDAQNYGYADLEGTITGGSMLIKNTSKNISLGIFVKHY